ncbi:MAG: crossover junction endodeoxyribonuclease RuvC [Deltaproteobacteria bacterium]|nr:crossover junction endodeoxyribonuclease RuvC [Deltaproteobacteria bacterium]
MNTTILGIDPGTRKTGWGVVRITGGKSVFVAGGTLRLDRAPTLSHRLALLAAELETLLDTHQPDHCAVEQVFHGKNARSALVLGHARGVVLAMVGRRAIPIFEYSPSQVKQAVTGSGRAAKEQVNRMVRLLLAHQPPLAEDEADALAVALAHGVAIPLLGKQ